MSVNLSPVAAPPALASLAVFAADKLLSACVCGYGAITLPFLLACSVTCTTALASVVVLFTRDGGGIMVLHDFFVHLLGSVRRVVAIELRFLGVRANFRTLDYANQIEYVSATVT